MNVIVKKGLVLLKQLIIALVVAVFIWIVIAMIFEEQFIFFPSKYPSGIYEDAKYIPRLRDCWITTEDSVRIHGWFAPAENALATLVMAHGNAGNISHRIPIIRQLQSTGFNVLMFDYRGYGKSEGSPDEEGIYKDGKAVLDYTLTLPEVNPKRIVLWGTSLGGAVVIEVATQRTAAALILEATFTSMQEMAGIHYSFLPARYILRTKLNSIEKISSIHIPILSIHGTEDEIVPLDMGKELFDKANEPKEFYEIPGADHNNTFFVGGTKYYTTVKEFVNKYLQSH
jgi:fermentation-respiration switch protein FrsA (DUF1100 family)